MDLERFGQYTKIEQLTTLRAHFTIMHLVVNIRAHLSVLSISATAMGTDPAVSWYTPVPSVNSITTSALRPAPITSSSSLVVLASVPHSGVAPSPNWRAPEM